MLIKTLGERVADRWWAGNEPDERDVKRALAVMIDSEAAKTKEQPVGISAEKLALAIRNHIYYDQVDLEFFRTMPTYERAVKRSQEMLNFAKDVDHE